MKSVIIILSTLFTFSALAGDPMTEAQKEAYMQKVAKEIRKTYWRSGHEDVESQTQLFAKSDIDEYVKKENNQRYHDSLDSEQIANLYRCHYEPKCEVYLISVTGSYHSGWGEMSHFVFLDTMEPRHESFSHLVYGE